MKYILDTDTLIYFLKGHKKIVEKVAAISLDDMAITIINHTELLFGAFNSIKKKENLEKIEQFLQSITILPFCEQASYLFAEYKASLKKQGTILADLDLIIASIAMQSNSILVTNNVRHFERIRKLTIENWVD